MFLEAPGRSYGCLRRALGWRVAGRRNFANLTLKPANTLYPFSSGFYPFPTLLYSDIFFSCLFVYFWLCPALDAVQGLFTAVNDEVQVEVELVLGSLLQCMGFSAAVVLSCPSTHGILVLCVHAAR